MSEEQFETIRALVKELWESPRSVFYHRFWGERGFDPTMLKEPSDFFRIPLLRKPDLLKAQKRAFDAYLYFPELVRYIRTTGGTTSKTDENVLLTFQNDELRYALKASEKNVYRGPRRPLVLKPAGGAVRDTAQFILAGAMPVIGDVFDLKRSAYLAQKAKVDGVFSYAPLIPPLVEILEKEYGYRREYLTHIVLEQWSLKELVTLRRLLPHAHISSGYGLSEFGISMGRWCDAVAMSNFEDDPPYMHLRKTVFMEILAPDGFRHVSDGERGEIVATPLVKVAAPLIRYATGDSGILWGGKSCPCGEPGPLFRFTGRIRPDLVSAGGFTFWEHEFDTAVRALAHDIHPRFRVTVGEELMGNAVKPKITIEVIPKTGAVNSAIIAEHISRRIAVSGRHTLADALAAGLCLPLEVRCVDDLPEGTAKLVSEIEY